MDLSMLPDFIVEALEHLEEMEEGLLQLERDQKNGDVLDEIFRSIHSIKGAAQYIGLARISALSHRMESLLDLIRQGNKQLNHNEVDLFIDVKDCLYSLVGELERTRTEETEIDNLLHRLDEALGEQSVQEQRDHLDEAPGEPSVQVQKDNFVAPRKALEVQGRLKNEALDEEYDEELLVIFMRQLKENFGFLQTQITELDTAVDKVAMLNRCRHTIKSLYSSANYMGYNMLCSHYEAWQVKIDAAEYEFSSGKEPDLDFMQLYLDEVVRVYPQIGVEADQEQSEDSTADSEEDVLNEGLEALFADFLEHASLGEEEEGSRSSQGMEEEADDLQAALSDVFDETIEPTGTGRELTRLENETLNEEYDEELLAIFMQQLQENIGFLQKQIVELGTSGDKLAVLNQCRDTIKSLYSSANYMGYDMLRDHYKAWQEKIDGAEHELSSDKENAELDFMQVYLDEIVSVYPETAGEKEQKPVETTMQESKDDLLADSDDEIPESPSGSTSTANESSERFQEKDSPAGDEEGPVAQASDTTPTDQELFGKLNDALESSFDHDEELIPVKEMHGVIEEMISTSDENAVAAQNITEEEMSGSLPDVPPLDATEEEMPDSLPDLDTTEEEIPDSLPDLDTKEEVAQQQQNLQDIERFLMDERLPQSPKKDTTAAKKVKQSMRVDADKIDYLMNQVGELVVSRAYFAQLFNEIKVLHQGLLEKSGLTKAELKPLNEFSFKLGEAGVSLGRVSNELQEAVMKVRMLPVAQLFKRYPRLVRDLVNKSDKQVNLELKGKETELDKMVIEEISDPLIHIIRNAIDHGIETVSERKHLGKPETGTLNLKAYHESNHIVIEVTDDGRGIDPERVKAKALERGLYSKEELERMTSLDLTRLIMMPGFSTAEKATETSGRGVGMDVVKRNIEKLNGTIDIESTVGRQTRIRIKIPLTLAIIAALMVRVGKETFTIPLTTVEETLRIFQREISEIEGVEVIHLRDTTMPIFRLSKLFRMQKKSGNSEENKFFVVVVSAGMQRVGLVVDELLGQEEVVIKPLADYLRVESGFSGATIIRDGAISLILDIPELIKMSTEQQVSKQKNLAFKRRTGSAGVVGQDTETIH